MCDKHNRLHRDTMQQIVGKIQLHWQRKRDEMPANVKLNKSKSKIGCNSSMPIVFSHPRSICWQPNFHQIQERTNHCFQSHRNGKSLEEYGTNAGKWTSLGGSPWSAWTSWAKDPVSVLYDSMTRLIRNN